MAWRSTQFALYAIVALTGLHYLVANLFAIGVATAWNFTANTSWTWRRHTESRPPAPMTGWTATDDLVIVPTYNEAANIERLIETTLDQGPFAVLVVDDNSPDGTGTIAADLAHDHPGQVAVIHRTGKDGLGAAYREGFDRGLETGAARTYQMDADFSHDPTALAPMRDRMLDGADLLLGSRYVDGGAVEGWPAWRMLLSRGGSLYAGAILGLSIET